MSTTTSTSVQLTGHIGYASSRPNTSANTSSNRVRPIPSRTEDEVLEASRAADCAAPDGGYGWAIVAAGCVLMWWAVGTTYSWGVIQRTLVDQGIAGPAVVSFIGSLQAAMVSLCATANAWLLQYIGPQKTALTGVALMGASGILSSFTTHNLAGLFVTGGVLFGIGASFVFCVITSVPAQYFSRKRGLANGLIFAGSGLGGAAISVVMDPIIAKIGLPMAYRVLGLTTLATGLPAAWIMKQRTNLPRRKFIEWKLFKSANFLLLCVATAIGTFPLYVPPFFLPLYANSLGFSSATGAGLVAGFTLSSGVGRILCGFGCDMVGAANVLFLSLIMTAVSMLAIWPASTTLGPLVLFVIINGMSNGGFFGTMPTMAGNIFGSARVGVVMGMIITCWIGGYLMGSPIAGYLLEAFGGASKGLVAYRPAMFYGGSLSFFSALLVLIARFRISSKIFAKV